MTNNTLLVVLFILSVVCTYILGRMSAKPKKVGVIHIVKNRNPNGMDFVKFDFGIQTLEELYSMKECCFVIDLREADSTINNSDNDNT